MRGLSGVLRLRFEDLFHNPDQEALRKLARFIGFSGDETRRRLPALKSSKANATKQYAIPRWPAWSRERRRTFDRVAGAHMQHYYDYQRITQ